MNWCTCTSHPVSLSPESVSQALRGSGSWDYCIQHFSTCTFPMMLLSPYMVTLWLMSSPLHLPHAPSKSPWDGTWDGTSGHLFFPSVSIQDLHQPVAMCSGCITLSLYHLTRSYCSIDLIEPPLGSHHLSICCHTSIIVKKPIYWYIHYQYYCTQWGCEYQEVLPLQPLNSETLIRNTEDRVRLDIVASDFGCMGSLRGHRSTPMLGC